MKRVQVGVGSIRLTRPSPTTSSCSKMFVLMVSLSVERASYCVLARHRGCSSRSSACWGVGCQLRRCSCSVQCVHASACRLRGGMLLAAGAADAVQSMLLSGLLLAVGTGSLAVRRHVPCVVCMCSGVELHEAHVVVCHGVGGKRSLRSFFRVERNLLRPGMVYRLGPACWRAAIALQQRCGMRRAQNQTLAFSCRRFVAQPDEIRTIAGVSL